MEAADIMEKLIFMENATPKFFPGPASDEQRMLVLQIRDAGQRAVVEGLQFENTPLGILIRHYLNSRNPDPRDKIQQELKLQMISRVLKPAVDASMCAICQEVFSTPVELPCGHRFDRECIEKWFMEDQLGIPGCPICREDTRKEMATRALAAAEALTPWWLTMLRGW